MPSGIYGGFQRAARRLNSTAVIVAFGKFNTPRLVVLASFLFCSFVW